MVGDCFPEWECKVRLFSCDIVNILLKINGGGGEAEAGSLILKGGGRGRKLNFVAFSA